MQTSSNGIDFLEIHEAVVLRAYRCPAGIWTIGAGLTAASGVVTPKAGMQITVAEARRLLILALRRNYEPSVARVMPGAAPHEFDAGVSFHFNTGAIGRASWVRCWIERDWNATKAALGLWNKGGGRVLPGLVRRRGEEFELLRHARYGHAVRVRIELPLGNANARIAPPLTAADLPRMVRDFATLGYKLGQPIALNADEVRRFQRDHGLTVDAIIGRATAATLQRRIDARRKLAETAVGGAALGGAEATALPEVVGLPDWAGWVALAVLGVIALRQAWNYRDALAAKLQRIAPSIAEKLRSI